MTEELPIMTLRQPWAQAVIFHGKNVENRVANIAGDYRGPIAIHAGLRRFDPRSDAATTVAALTGYRPLMFTRQGYGHILGVVDLVDVHPGWMEPKGHLCSPWALDYVDGAGQNHLVLANPRPLAEPIPYKGALGLRRLDEETAERVRGGLA